MIGPQTAAALLERLSASTGDGRELELAADGAQRQPAAWRRGFWRLVQKRIERQP